MHECMKVEQERGHDGFHLHEVAARAGHCCSALAIVTVDHVHEIEMRVLLPCFHVAGGSFGEVVILQKRSAAVARRLLGLYLVIANGYGVVNDVADFMQRRISVVLDLDQLLFRLLDLRIDE